MVWLQLKHLIDQLAIHHLVATLTTILNEWHNVNNNIIYVDQ